MPSPKPPPPGEELTYEVLEQLPKTDLHVHLDGSMRLETILELAEKQKIKLPAQDTESLRKALHVGQICASLEEYLVAFDITLAVLQDAEALYRAAYELAEDAARENVRYLEVRYSPILHQRKGLPLPVIVDCVLQGLRDAERKQDLKTGVILCGIRNMDPETSMRLAELTVAYKNKGVVAFDLAGSEYNHPAKHHATAFGLVLNNDVNCTTHAGEAYGPESIRQALHYCGAHRIGHGTRLREDGDLLNYVNDHRIPVEICLSSNIQTQATKSFETHPLKFYFELGLRVSMNTDNRLLTDTTVTKELWLAHRHYGFRMVDLKELIINGFKSAFLPFRQKQELLRRVVDEMARFAAPGVPMNDGRPAPPEVRGDTEVAERPQR